MCFVRDAKQVRAQLARVGAVPARACLRLHRDAAVREVAPGDTRVTGHLTGGEVRPPERGQEFCTVAPRNLLHGTALLAGALTWRRFIAGKSKPGSIATK